MDWLAPIEVERSLLGCLLDDSGGKLLTRFLELSGGLDLDLFYNSDHKLLIRAIFEVWKRDNTIDPLTVSTWIESSRDELLMDYGGIYDIVETFFVPENLGRYVQMLQSAKKRRCLVSLSEEVLNRAKDPGWNEDSIHQYALTELQKLNRNGHEETVGHILEEIALSKQNGDEKVRISTGFDKLDDLIGDFESGEVFIIAARPGQGKTTLALNIALRQLDNWSIAFFQYEMSARQLVCRLVSAIAEVPFIKLVRKMTTEEEDQRVQLAVEMLKEKKIHICNKPLTLESLYIEMSQIKQKFGGVFIPFIDYLQLIPGGKGDNDYERITKTSRTLKNMATDLDLPLIALSQLSRRSEYREGQEPSLADLRGSGAIEEDASVVVMLHRAGFYNNEIPDNRIKTFVRKARHGKMGEVELEWHGDTFRIGNRKLIF